MLSRLAAATAQDPAEPAQRTIEYLWPSNVDTWLHWQAVQTQWRIGGMGGMGGNATGLDYAGVRAYLDEEGVYGEARKDAFAGIRAAERATLQAIGEKVKPRQSKED